MAETRIIDIIEALVDAANVPGFLPAGVYLSDGYPLSNAPGDYLAVGVDDPFDEARAESAEATQDFALAAGRSRDEAASIRCAAYAVRGSGNLREARRAAHDIVSTVGALARSGQAPFNLQNGIRKAGVTDLRFYTDPATEYGAECLISFSLTFTARI